MRLVRLLRDVLGERAFAARTDDGRRLELRELIVALASRRRAFRFIRQPAGLFGFSVGEGASMRLYVVRPAPPPLETRTFRLLGEALVFTAAGMAGTLAAVIAATLA